jgi:hypothetical protein
MRGIRFAFAVTNNRSDLPYYVESHREALLYSMQQRVTALATQSPLHLKIEDSHSIEFVMAKS